ncbi:MAG: alpha/beta hydrolase-fold protein, partial [Candidatus Eisenbacteria bacterium]
GIDETAERLIAEGKIAPLIVVGVYNSPDRVNEYTPVADPVRGGGGAGGYGRFLVEELKPFIDATYRTRAGKAFTGVAGSSLGGLVSLHLGLTYPDVFSRIGVVSPSVGWAGAAILDEVASSQGAGGRRIWLDMGGREGGNVDEQRGALEGARRLRDALIGAGWQAGIDLYYLEDAQAVHNEAAWAKRAGGMLEFLFPPPPD